MAHHGRHKRAPQSPNNNPNLPASILPPGSIQSTDTPATDGGVASATSQNPLTTVTSTFVQVNTIDGVVTTSSFVEPVTITDSAVFAQITASEANKTPSSSSSPTTSSKAASSTAASHKSSTSLSTLVPIVVVPIAVVLIASLGLFWFFMRRRHQKELKNPPEFVMTGKGEKLRSRSNSSRSEKTPPTSFGLAEKKKEPLATVVEKPVSETGPWMNMSKVSSDEIGIARPLTLQDSRPNTSNGPKSPNYGLGIGPGPAPYNRPYQNFNEPRPSTARQAPPTRNGQSQGRHRSSSSPSRRRPPGSSHGRDPYETESSHVRDHYRTGPSPILRSGPFPLPPSRVADPSRDVGGGGGGGGGAPPPSHGLPSNPRINLSSNSPPTVRLRVPSPAMGFNARSGPPAPVRAPPPGAFNGASPISQYSPIVKDVLSLNASVTPIETNNGGVGGGMSSGGGKRSIPPPILTTSTQGKKRPTRPRRPSSGSNDLQDSGLTEENLRIARLANSSRLGFTGDPAPSPKLPPPATRSQLIPHESPGEEREQYFTSATGTASHSRNGSQPQLQPHDQDHGHDRILDLNFDRNSDDEDDISEPDDYEDIDVRSDVSSLNDGEGGGYRNSRHRSYGTSGGRRRRSDRTSNNRQQQQHYHFNNHPPPPPGGQMMGGVGIRRI